MDTIDQAIFLLGYIEDKVLQTPKEVLLNEMIELAKRYSDE
jgi:transcription termination factor NusB